MYNDWKKYNYLGRKHHCQWCRFIVPVDYCMFLLLVSVILYQLGVVGKSTVSVNLFMKENLHDLLVVNK